MQVKQLAQGCSLTKGRALGQNPPTWFQGTALSCALHGNALSKCLLNHNVGYAQIPAVSEAFLKSEMQFSFLTQSPLQHQ